MKEHLNLRWTPVALAALSGMAALGHQMIWTRRLVDLLGASPLTFSKVVGAFFLGLAAGAAVAAVRSGEVSRPWLRVAVAEFIIGALAIPPLFAANLPARPVMQYLTPFLLVTPPAFVMGLVLPWMVRAMRGGPHAAIWLYAANTLGGVAGIIVVMLWALPAVGLTAAALGTAGINLVVAFIALGLRSVGEAQAPTQPQQQQGHATLLAFASGFLVLALEVIAQHQFAQVTINSYFSSGTVLVWVLISLAVAAAIQPWLAGWLSIRGILLLAALACGTQPFVLTAMREGVTILPYELPMRAYSLELGKLAILTLAPMFLGAGLLFPALLATAGSPARVAKLLAWNGAGGWLGTELAQYLIVPRLGLWQSACLAALAYCVLSFLLPGRRWIAIPALALLMLAFVRSESLPQVTPAPDEQVAALNLGPEGVVATVAKAPDDWRMLFNNSYTLGGSKAQFNQERQAHLPILLHGNARTVAVLGVATGSTLAGAAMHADMQKIDAAELSPLVLQHAKRWFEPFNRRVFHDPRVRVIAQDARWLMVSQRHTYDVVVGDLFLPWRTGEGRLFAREHFEAVRRALKTNGLFCQWLPMFQLTRSQYETVVRTFLEIFPGAFLLRGDFYTELPILALVGGRELNQVDWTQVSKCCDALRNAGVVTDPLVRGVHGVAMLVIGPVPAPSEGPMNTLANSWLEWDAARNIIGLREPWFIGVPGAEYIRAVHQAGHASMPPSLKAAHDAGQFFLTLEIAIKVNASAKHDLLAQAQSRLPPALLKDSGADWRQWPMRVKPAFAASTSGASRDQ